MLSWEFGVWQLFIGGCVKYGTPYALDLYHFPNYVYKGNALLVGWGLPKDGSYNFKKVTPPKDLTQCKDSRDKHERWHFTHEVWHLMPKASPPILVW